MLFGISYPSFFIFFTDIFLLFYSRENRSKHDKHCSKRNIRVIEKCTNMWWNPLNSIKHKAAAQVELLTRKRKERGVDDPASTSYWAEGEGSKLKWKFDCRCGEVCSYYEKYIFHPTGRMYECTSCKNWSHVLCNFGDISDEELGQGQVFKLLLSYTIFLFSPIKITH